MNVTITSTNVQRCADDLTALPGYKNTEVGVIPKDWEIRSLGQIGQVIRGASPRPKGDKRYYGGQVPRLMVEDVTRDGKYVTPSVDFLTEEGVKRSRPCKKGTLTIVCSGTVGIPSFLAVDACIHDGFLALIELDRSVYNDYLFHQLTSVQERFNLSATHGGVFTNLTTSILREFKVAIPSSPEQRAIAVVLSDVDKLIVAIDKLIVKKRAIMQVAMQQLLTGKQRLPGFDGERLEVEICDLVDPNKEYSFAGGPFGSNLKTNDYTDDGIQIVQLQNIGDGAFIDNSQVFTSTNKAEQLFSSNIYAGDIILSKMGDPVARACLIPQNKKRMLMCSDGIRLAVNEDKYNKLFILYSINHSRFRKEAESNSIGTTRKRISLLTLKKMKLSIPQKAEQDILATVLSDMEAEISALEQRRDKTKAIKQGMMQSLLTGRVRLVTPGKGAEE